MAVYFKFNSWNQKNFDTIPLDGALFISVAELKQQIIKKKKLEKGVGLVLTNAQSNEGFFYFYERIKNIYGAPVSPFCFDMFIDKSL